MKVPHRGRAGRSRRAIAPDPVPLLHTPAARDPAAPNCVYLIRAEERFGDGDGIFSVSEQQRASTAYYRSNFGRQAFLGAGRVARLGVRVSL